MWGWSWTRGSAGEELLGLGDLKIILVDILFSKNKNDLWTRGLNNNNSFSAKSLNHARFGYLTLLQVLKPDHCWRCYSLALKYGDVTCHEGGRIVMAVAK